MICTEPDGRELVVICAPPLVDNFTADPMLTPFAVKVTVPVGTGPPDWVGVTCAVKMTF